MAIVRKRLGEILVEANMITEDQLRVALDEQRKSKETLGQILVRLGFLTENNIRDALELQFGINYVNINRLEIAPEVLKLLPEQMIRQLQAIPISLQNNKLNVAMVDPTNLMALDDIRLRVKGVQVQASVITEDDFIKLLDAHFNKKKGRDFEADSDEAPRIQDWDEEETFADTSDILDEMVDLVEDERDDTNVAELARASEDAPIIRLANSLLINALKQKASDIHIEPQEKHVMVRYRIDGTLQKQPALPKKLTLPLVSRFKIMSNLNIAEKRLPQDGRIRIRYRGKDIDFRVSTLPSKHGEKIVMRILDKSNTTLGLDKLFIYPDMLKQVREMVDRPYGIIFVTGPTGSGKTTSLYSILAERNSPEVNITTAEDPIEYDLAGITQVQAQPEIGLTFARILKAFLRQDPDIMLIGETRDKELAKIAIESALTGHLVFTSLHTNDAAGAVTRLQEMGVDGFLIASATIGVIAQRLVKRLCPNCRIQYEPEKNLLDYVGYPYKPGEQVLIYRPNPDGCSDCNKGYKGRMGVYEILQFNDEIRDIVNRNGNKAMIRFAAKQAGMVPLKDYSLKLVADGHTALDEVLRVTMTDEGEETLCPNCRNPIGDEFIKCPFCQVDLKKLCGACHRVVESSWLSCPTCGASLANKSLPLATDSPRHGAPAPDRTCISCQAPMDADWETCPKCQTVQRPLEHA